MPVYSAENILKMKDGRTDCTNYLIHFTRNQNRGNKKLSALAVLEQILLSGYIECSWSIRNAKRTIFGPRPAVCFTEMPLWGLELYAKNRGKRDKIASYGIAFRKDDLFKKGARNVIYGTTGPAEIETKHQNTGEMYNPALPIKEQYRYMLTGINDINDWTHEREWRWAGWEKPEWMENLSIEGLPFYQELTTYDIGDAFKEIIVIVNTKGEKIHIQNLLNHIVQYNCSKQKSNGILLDANQVKKTKVIAIQELKKNLGSYFTIEEAKRKQLI